MHTIALISQKGGVGKTTLATGLAVTAHRDGRAAAVIDTDPQASASFWKDSRVDEAPAVVAAPASRLRHVLEAADANGCELVVIDTPPLAKEIAFEAAQHADLILIPTRPAVLDIQAMTRTLELVAQYRRRAAVVLTLCPFQGREMADSQEVIRQLGAAVAPVRIHNRIAFSRAQQTGRSAAEIEPGGKAADELKQLYEYTCMMLNTSEAGG